MPVTIRVVRTKQGLRGYIRGLETLGARWTAETAHLQVRNAQAEAPVGQEGYTDPEGHAHPGWLRDSIDRVPLPGDSQLVTVHADYGIYVNNGTRWQAPNPFWDRALEQTRRQAGPLLRTLARSILRRGGTR